MQPVAVPFYQWDGPAGNRIRRRRPLPSMAKELGLLKDNGDVSTMPGHDAQRIARGWLEWVFGDSSNPEDKGLMNEKVVLSSAGYDIHKCMTLSKEECTRRKLWWGKGNKYVKGKIKMGDDGPLIIESVHRIVCWCRLQYPGYDPQQAGDKPQVLHNTWEDSTCRQDRDGVVVCVNPFHMEWGTAAQNKEDTMRHKKRRRT